MPEERVFPSDLLKRLEEALFEIRRVIAGQEEMLERVLVCLLSGGHLLIEGVPGLAKTLTIKSTAAVLGGTLLSGGRGTFIGAVVSALLLTLIINILPLLGLSNVVGLVTVGVLMVAALILYQIGDLKELIRLK